MSENNKEDKTIALQVLIGMGMGMLWLTRNLLKAVAWTAATVLGVVEAVAGQNKEPELAGGTRAANKRVPVAEAFEPKVSVDERSAINHEFKIADRFTTIQLEPMVGVIHLRHFNAEGLYRCDLVIHEPKLRTMMQGRRHALPDISMDPQQSLDQVKEQAIAAAQELFDKFGEKRRVKQGVAKVTSEQRPAEPKPQPQAKPAVQEAQPASGAVQQALAALSKNEAAASAEAKNPAFQAKKFSGKPVTNVTYEGKLIYMGRRKFTPAGRKAFETFQATIQLDSGIEVPLRGAELERELEHMGVQPGEKISITPMGKVPVDLANGEVGEKNVYRVARIQ